MSTLRTTGERQAARERMAVRLWISCVSLVCSFAHAAENYVSKPAGFIRLEIASNASVLVSTPFAPQNGQLGIVFNNQLTGADSEESADRVLKWNNAAQQYIVSYKKEQDWFQSGSTNYSTQTVAIGEGFWIENRHSDRSVYLAGAVVLSETQTWSFAQGLSVFGYPYSSLIDINESALALDGAFASSNAWDADQVIEGITSNTAWLSDQNGGTWLDLTNGLSGQALGMGKGFWYERKPANTFQWSEARPYENLFETGANAPTITAIVVDTNQVSMTLQIACSGAVGETLEIYYKDLSSVEAFTSQGGWSLAAEDLETEGQSLVSWNDAGTSNRAAVSEVFCRVYLVGRQDIDSDSDGLSDARELFVDQTGVNVFDTDEDGLSDGQEVLVFETNPNDGDTDNDGMWDGSEVAWGHNPLTADSYAGLPWVTGFETNENYAIGDLNGQNSWTVSEGSAAVQNTTVYSGEQAVRMGNGGSESASGIQHFYAANTGDVVWTDMKVRLLPGHLAEMSNDMAGLSAVVAVNPDGHLAGYDGNGWVIATNGLRYAYSTWLHLTVKSDYDTAKWMLYKNGMPVLQDLGFADSTVKKLSRLAAAGSERFGTYIDDLEITENAPSHIDDDADGLANIAEDLDGDGVVDAGETDPFGCDTDGDGMDDGQETAYGLDPTTSNAFARLPWFAGFENEEGYSTGALHDQQGWIATTSALVQDEESYSGTNAVELAVDAGMEHYIGGQGETIVWMEVYSKLQRGQLPAVGTLANSNSVLLAVNQFGVLCGYDAKAQVWIVGSGDPIDPEVWTRVVVGLNYNTKTWCAYLGSERVLNNVSFMDEEVRWLSKIMASLPSGKTAKTMDVDALSITATEPADLDNDGDGMFNAWERQYGLDPEDAGDANADPDADGLSNIEEFETGTDPLDWDTDGDGVSDGEEVLTLHTDPLVAEFDGTVTDIDVVFGNETNAALGDWLVQGSEILDRDVRGYVEYNVNCPTGDIYRIVVEATHIWNASSCMPLTPIDKSDMILYVDGENLGKHRLTASNTYGSVATFTPWLTAGTHTVRVYWDNVHFWVSLKIKKVRLQQLGGPDANGNGIKDWVEYAITHMNTLDVIPSVSVVSPVCIEGKARFVNRTVVNSGDVQQGITGTWYADIPLSPSGVTPVAVSFENGVVGIATNISWIPLNVINGDDLVIRVDDSVALTALAVGETNGDVALNVEGITNATTTADQPLICHFADPGEYQVSGVFSNGGVTASDSILIKVVNLNLPTNALACMMGQVRTLDWTNDCDHVEWAVDETVTTTYSSNILGVLMHDIDAEHRLIVRLRNGGPILGTMDLQGFWLQAAVDGYIWVVEEYADSQLWENCLLAKNLPDCVDVHLWSFISGVTFDDLTLERWISRANFNELEIYPFRLLHPNSVQASTCHTIKAFQAGALVGESYYSGNLFPDE